MACATVNKNPKKWGSVVGKRGCAGFLSTQDAEKQSIAGILTDVSILPDTP